MWIPEDFEREIWKKRVFVLPACWKEIVGDRRVFPAGMVRCGELLFAPQTLSRPVWVFYYNLKTHGFRRRRQLATGSRLNGRTRKMRNARSEEPPDLVDDSDDSTIVPKNC
ncbi:hypothetical protein NL676_032165 [Syzygium grande]|nr:hypothetical protein NL676_032165 [Syzygium grande]